MADSTGAGDAFWAGFLSALLQGESVIEAARQGQVLAEIKVGEFGPLVDLPSIDQLKQRSADIPYFVLNG